MRKVFSILIALTFLVGAHVASAVNMDDLVIIVTENTAATPLTTNVSTSTLIPGKHRIIGFDIYRDNTSVNAEKFIAVYDDTDTDIAVAGLVGENEALDGIETAGKILPKPKYISNGLTIRQGGNTISVIYAERYLP